MKDAPNKAHIENINNIFKLAPLILGRGRGGYNFDQRQEPARNVCDQTFPTGYEVLP
jgi:hypothetical protein